MARMGFRPNAEHTLSARLDADRSGIMKSLLTEALVGIEGRKQTTPLEDSKGPATLVVDGVTGKRIRTVSLEEAGGDLPDMAYLAVEFDDDTELQFNVGVRSQLVFTVSHNARGEDDEMEPVKRLDEATIRSLVRQQEADDL